MALSEHCEQIAKQFMSVSELNVVHREAERK